MNQTLAKREDSLSNKQKFHFGFNHVVSIFLSERSLKFLFVISNEIEQHFVSVFGSLCMI